MRQANADNRHENYQDKSKDKKKLKIKTGMIQREKAESWQANLFNDFSYAF